MLPQVFTPDLPVSPADLAPFISSLDCFETPALGREDFHRTEMYQAERGRREVVEMSGGVETWLRSLQIEVRVTRLQKDNLARAAQLLNKTNQFNLALRRMDEQTFWNWGVERGNSAYVFHVSDRFGDFGLTGMVTVSREGRDAQIVDFVMSCRVMGKKVEEALLGYVFTQALADGAVRVKAPAFEDSSRNAPAREFFAAKYLSGDDAVIDPERVAVPSAVTLKEESLAPA